MKVNAQDLESLAERMSQYLKQPNGEEFKKVWLELPDRMGDDLHSNFEMESSRMESLFTLTAEIGEDEANISKFIEYLSDEKTIWWYSLEAFYSLTVIFDFLSPVESPLQSQMRSAISSLHGVLYAIYRNNKSLHWP